MFRLHRGALARARASTLAAALATTLALAACGGGSPSPQSPPDGSGGPSTPSGPTAPAPAPAPERFAALGTSADSVSLDWVTPAGSARVRLQRQRADGGYDDVADLPAGPGRVVDTGLAPQTLYRYRLVARDAPTQALAEASATTSDEVAPVTAAGTPQGEPDTLTLGATGGSVASPDGHITLQLPAGALAAGTAVTTQTVSNTAPDGVGPALHVRLAAAPSAALTVRVRWDAAQDPRPTACASACSAPTAAGCRCRCRRSTAARARCRPRSRPSWCRCCPSHRRQPAARRRRRTPGWSSSTSRS